MAIVEPAPDGEHLAQGDILRGLTVYRARANTDVERIEPSFMLVLSRNCNASREPYVIVAAVAAFRREGFGRLGDEASLDKSRRYMAGLRDGWLEPDVFYLGPLPAGEPGQRYAADLRIVGSVGLSTVASERTQWLTRHRVARLSRAHRRHLHGRLFRAFADEGFDDHEWWPTADLELVVNAGKHQIAVLDQQIAELKLKLGLGQSDGKTTDRALKGLRASLAKKQAALSSKKAELDPYLLELGQRSPE